MADKKEKARALAASAEQGGPTPLGERDEGGLTPLQKQYFEIKGRYRDTLLLFRLGDFYELFDADAVTASRELDLMLTTRDRGKPSAEQMPMCGVPYHSAESYIARLLQKGYKVAVCEQLEDPALAKGLVKRDVVRVITPGMVTDGAMLDSGRPNYICAVCLTKGEGAAAFCDISTGEFAAVSYRAPAARHLMDALASFAPREALLDAGALGDASLCAFLEQRLGCLVERGEEYAGYFEGEAAAERACRQFNAEGPEDLAGRISRAGVRACGALLRYIDDTQKCDLGHISSLMVLSNTEYMELDWSVRRALELTSNQRTGEKRGSLLWVLDRTKTAMGARMLRSWVELPLRRPVDILRRLAAVRELAEDNVLRRELMTALDGMGDMQRIAPRTVNQTANGRDLLALAAAAGRLPEIKRLLRGCKSAALAQIAGLDELGDVREIIEQAVNPKAPLSVRDGDVIREGFSAEADRLRALRDNSVDTISAMESREQERTGIKKLRIGYNRVFGYYIDVPGKVPESELPADYVRKQTLVNHERYFTVELKALEAELASARDSLARLEYELFCETRGRVAAELARIQASAEAAAELDSLCSLAETAVRNGYTCPELDMSGVIDIRGGRHPVVELMQRETRFVPNDAYLNMSTDRLAVITGPNMAGKSTYLRQTALIVLMAQMGSYVPARSASIGVVDRVFTRIGASDDLSGGRSTFMVEMTEVAEILKSATEDSLILLDEIGRGTSTYDGVAIARAVLEFCADPARLGARTLLATHYHELTELEGRVDGVKNYCSTARKQGGSVIFLRHIARGAADESYGIEVASLAGVPKSVVARARECLEELARSSARPAAPPPEADAQLSLGESAEDEALETLRRAKLDTLSPIEAMNLLYELQRKLEP